MQILIDIKDSKAEFIINWLKQYSFVKIKPVSPKKAAKAQFLDEIEESVAFMKKVSEGKTEGRPAKELLDEL